MSIKNLNQASLLTDGLIHQHRYLEELDDITGPIDWTRIAETLRIIEAKDTGCYLSLPKAKSNALNSGSLLLRVF